MSSHTPKKSIHVYLAEREVDLLEDGRVIATFDCLIGREGHETRPGAFRVLLKDKDKVSRTYNAPMPYALKFDRDWKAIHQSSNFFWRNVGMSLGVDAAGSHGCVGLSEADAKRTFEWAAVGTPVIILAARSKSK